VESGRQDAAVSALLTALADPAAVPAERKKYSYYISQTTFFFELFLRQLAYKGNIIGPVTMLATKFYSTDALDADAKIGIHNVNECHVLDSVSVETVRAA
jgi:hypothetical protein